MATSPKTGDIDMGRKIAARRDELGMTRKQLAEATGLSYPYIAQIETGYRMPSTRHQVPLTRVLGMSLDELFGDEETPERSAPRAAPIRRHKTTIEDAVERAVHEIEGLPTSVRLEALARIQLRVMQGVTEEQARQHSR